MSKKSFMMSIKRISLMNVHDVMWVLHKYMIVFMKEQHFDNWKKEKGWIYVKKVQKQLSKCHQAFRILFVEKLACLG